MPDRSFVTLTGHITCYRQSTTNGIDNHILAADNT